MGCKKEPKTAKAFKANKTSSFQLKELRPNKDYSSFDQLDGTHPWMKKMPEGFISYPVRILKKGTVGYFNFSLAKEMGLISKSHPEKYTSQLKEKLIETFSLQIINEYDQLHRRRFSKESIKTNEYMATRYLQLQHTDKTGKTSGDGRSIWNGTVRHNGKTWDVSSRGTGVTALAPGMVTAGRPLKTGSEEFGYGCGLAEIDELYSTAMLSEIFHNQGIETERTLAIIDLGQGVGIGVRAGQNLLRPAHIFSHLKQNDHSALVRSIDYLIDRQKQNKEWKFSAKHPQKYERLLNEVCVSFAKMSAIFDVDYIFAWLDWDGDNILTNAGIIDYGSIRQFGLRYDQYRYDDVERFSTTLNEQKGKAELIVQVFAQAIDYAKTGEKKSLTHYKSHKVTEEFNRIFHLQRLERVLYRVGFEKKVINQLIKKKYQLVEDFVSEYDYLERKKTSEPLHKVSDGLNRSAVFNVRNILREFPEFLISQEDFAKAEMSDNHFFDVLFAEGLSRKEKKVSPSMNKRSKKFQKLYKKLIQSSCHKKSHQQMLLDVCTRSHKINQPLRVTGNGCIHAVNEILDAKKKGLSNAEVHWIIQRVIRTQELDLNGAERVTKSDFKPSREQPQKVFKRILTLVENHEEDL